MQEERMKLTLSQESHEGLYSSTAIYSLLDEVG